MQELLARLTNDRGNVDYHSSTNSTLDRNAETFPTDQPINIDFTHDVTIGEVVTALNLTHFARELPDEHIEDAQPRWKSNAISPFGANLLVQTLSCGDTEYARVVLNDAVQPLDGLGACAGDEQSALGLCSMDIFIKALRQTNEEVDYAFDCFGDFDNTHVVHNGVPEL